MPLSESLKIMQSGTNFDFHPEFACDNEKLKRNKKSDPQLSI